MIARRARRSSRIVFAAVLAVLTLSLVAVCSATVRETVADGIADGSYEYDDAATAATTPPANNTRTDADGARPSPRALPGEVRLVSGIDRAATEADEGIVYLRTDKLGGKPYVGQSKSAAPYDAGQVEHVRYNPFADFEFSILARVKPGTELDRLEEYFIRGMGGPTTKRTPGGALANRRHQMSDRRYQEAGGAP